MADTPLPPPPSVPTETITIDVTDADGVVRQVTLSAPYDPDRRALIADLAVAHVALMNNANVPLVMKAWATRLLRVLRVVINDVRES